MKKNNIFIAFLVFGWAILLLQPIFAKTTTASNRAVVEVSGMVCDFCAQGISKKLKKNSRVKSHMIDLKNKKVIIIFKDDQTISKKELTNIIQQSGYGVRSIRYDQ